MRKIFTFLLMFLTAVNLGWTQDASSATQGEKKEYVKTFSGCFFTGAFDEFEGRETKASIVWGEDGTVGFPDMISMLPMGSNAKGTLEGDVVTVEVPQTVLHQEEDYGFMVVKLDYNLVLLKEESANGSKTYVPVTEKGAVTFTVQPDGMVQLDPLAEGYALGLTQDNGYGEAWYGAAEYSMTYSPVRDEPFDPTTLKKTAYSYITTGAGGQPGSEPDFGYKVMVGFDGDDVYFFNFCPESPEWWFMGHLDGTRVTVGNNQPLGSYGGVYDASLVFGKVDGAAPLGYSLLPDDTSFVFDYDAEKMVFTTATPEVVMFANCIPGGLTYFLTKLAEPTFVYQPTAEGTPLSPWGLSFYFDEYGVEPDTQGYLSVNLPIVSTEGVLLDRGDMHYNVYLDGVAVEFTKADYGMAEDSVDVPYLFNGNGVSAQKLSTMHQVRLRPDGAKKIGVGLVNVYDGVTYQTDVVEIDVPYSNVGITDVEAVGIVGEAFFDLSGCRVDESTKGLMLRRILFEDGSVRMEKVVRR